MLAINLFVANDRSLFQDRITLSLIKEFELLIAIDFCTKDLSVNVGSDVEFVPAHLSSLVEAFT